MDRLLRRCEYAAKKKRTRGKIFMAEKDQVVPWGTGSGRGHPAMGEALYEIGSKRLHPASAQKRGAGSILNAPVEIGCHRCAVPVSKKV